MTAIKPRPIHDSILTTLTNYLLISGMLTCVVISVVQLGIQISPKWNASYIPVLCFFVALESAYLTRYVRYHRLPVSWYILRGFEVVVWFLALRSLLGLMRGPQPAQSINPFSGYVDGELLTLVVLVLLTWLGSWWVTSDLLNLELIDPTLDREIIKDVSEAQDRSRQNLIYFVVVIGSVLVFLAALLRVYLNTTGQTALAAQYSLWHAIVFFGLALLLLSRVRLAVLRAGWVWEHIPLGHKVGTRWITYTLLMLGLAIIIAVVLPTQYSLGLLGTLGYILSIVVAIVQTIFYMIVALFYALLSLFFPNQQPGPQLAPPPLLSPLPAAPGAEPATLSEFVQSLIFWIVFFVVAGYMLVQFLRRHPEIVEALKRVPGAGLLLRLWRKLREWFGGLNQQLEDLLEARRRARRAAPPRSAPALPRWINLRKLSPRQQVRFYYLAMLRRGSEHGHAREPTQTPYEYARTLENQIPEIDQDVDGLTAEFIEARYSRHDIASEHVGIVRRYWEHIKQALRR